MYKHFLDCIFSISNLSTNYPLILQSNNIDFLYPDFGTRNITMAKGDSIELSCPQSTLSATNTTTATATCQSNLNFNINGCIVAINNITCVQTPASIARYTGKKCSTSNIKEIEIGFNIDTNRFLRVISICFDETNFDTVYSMYNLTKFIQSYETNVNRPSFTEGNFYNLSEKLNNLYTKKNQKININKQLNLAEDSELIIGSSNFYLAKGHLTAKTDFVYAPGQIATFYYINVAPQWQNFNSMNWNKIENSVRLLANTRELDLVVYTGIFGTLKYNNANGDYVDLYLYVDENNNHAVTIPELFWKLVYEPESEAALVIFGINNPYITDTTSSIICSDISKNIDWLPTGRDNVTAGYIYSCSYDEVVGKIQYFPVIDVKQILN